MISNKTHQDMLKLRNELQRTLKQAIKTRAKNFSDPASGRDFESELDTLWLAANEWAVLHEDDCVMVGREEIEKADQRAVGHSDWFNKLCLYVAEAVYDL